jgi:hypothetical protein
MRRTTTPCCALLKLQALLLLCRCAASHGTSLKLTTTTCTLFLTCSPLLAAVETTSSWLNGIKLVVAALAVGFLICDSPSFKRFGESLKLTRGTELFCYSAVHALVCCCVAFSSVWCGLGLMLTTVLPRLIDSVHCATIQGAASAAAQVLHYVTVVIAVCVVALCRASVTYTACDAAMLALKAVSHSAALVAQPRIAVVRQPYY